MKSKTLPRVSHPRCKRIFLVEDHPIFREGITRAIQAETDLTICGHSDSAQTAFSAIGRLKPDVALIDITLPGRSGLELIKDIYALVPETALVVLSMHDEFLFAERALQAGARGYVMKHEDTVTLIRAIRHVLGGGVFVSPRISERIMQNFSPGRSKPGRTSIEQLTDRELEVLQLIGRGHASPDIASQLHLSPKTVAVHRARIKEKLKLRTTSEMIRFALAWEVSEPATKA